MTFIPPPSSFAEGQRAISLWLMAAAGVFCGLGFVGLILILWLGGWAEATQAQRITVLALLGAGFPLGMIAVILALAVGGPVGRFKAGAGRDGATFELEDHDDPPATTVTTTTEVKPQ